jgi:hypothetical protein
LVIVFRIVLALIATFFFVFGLRFMLTPDAMGGEFFVNPIGAAGLSTIRGDLGGTFIGIGALIVLGLRPFATRWLHAAAVIPPWRWADRWPRVRWIRQRGNRAPSKSSSSCCSKQARVGSAMCRRDAEPC